MFEIQQNFTVSTYNSILFQIILIVKNLIQIFMVLSDILRPYQFAINMRHSPAEGTTVTNEQREDR